MSEPAGADQDMVIVWSSAPTMLTVILPYLDDPDCLAGPKACEISPRRPSTIRIVSNIQAPRAGQQIDPGSDLASRRHGYPIKTTELSAGGTRCHRSGEGFGER